MAVILEKLETLLERLDHQYGARTDELNAAVPQDQTSVMPWAKAALNELGVIDTQEKREWAGHIQAEVQKASPRYSAQRAIESSEHLSESKASKNARSPVEFYRGSSD